MLRGNMCCTSCLSNSVNNNVRSTFSSRIERIGILSHVDQSLRLLMCICDHYVYLEQWYLHFRVLWNRWTELTITTIIFNHAIMQSEFTLTLLYNLESSLVLHERSNIIATIGMHFKFQHVADSNYSSLTISFKIIELLLCQPCKRKLALSLLQWGWEWIGRLDPNKGLEQKFRKRHDA